MKRNVLLGLAVIGMATALVAPARAGVSFDVHIGFPLPPIPAVVVAPPPIVVARPPICPPPVVVVRPAAPVCPPPVVYCPPPAVVCAPAPVVISHPHFIPPGHARRYVYERVEYRHPGRGHGHH